MPETVREERSAGQSGGSAPSLEPDHDSATAEARLQRQVHLGHVAALVRQAHRRPSRPRHRRRSDRALLGHGACRTRGHRLHQSHRQEREDLSAEDRVDCPKSSSNGRFPSGATPSSATAPEPTSRPTRRLPRSTSSSRRWRNCTPARTKTWIDFKVPDEAIGCGFHEAVRGVLSHHVVIRNGKIANYHPYPPTPWNANPRDILRHAGTLRRRGAEHADLRGKRTGQVQGHRHHARGAQLRSLPALRRAHVSRQWQGSEDSPFTDVWLHP